MSAYTTIVSTDGFGAQYQKVIQTYLYCKFHGLIFKYTPFDKMEHNYANDQTYIKKKEELVNLYENMELATIDTPRLDYHTTVRNWHDSNLHPNLDAACNSEYMDFIKRCFWSNKDKDVYKNNKKNVAVHVRRSNQHDFGQAGDRVTTPDEYYLNIMAEIRNKYKAHNLQFHIYSQGNIGDFDKFKGGGVVMHIDEDIETSFIGMVGADILVTSPSSFSYVAALISDGEIYFKRFWHNPRSHWNIQ